MVRAEGILRLLIVDDSLSEADSVINALRIAGHAVRASRVETLDEVESAVNKQSWDMLICRDQLVGVSPREITSLLIRLGRDLPCIVLINKQSVETELFGCGAHDLVLVGDIPRLQFAVNRELDSLFMRRLCRRNERALRESEKRSRALLESSRDAVAYMHEGMHIYVNRAYLKLFGYEEAEDIDGLPILDLVILDDHARFKAVFRQFSEQPDSEPELVNVQCLKSDGSIFAAEIEFSHARVEGEDCTQVVVRDYSTTDLMERQSDLLSEHDLLTGFYSRSGFMNLFEKLVFEVAEGHKEAVLMYLVLDDFQSIKEQVGLANSDVILKSVAELLKKVQKEDELIGRYGDQVFTIVVPSSDAKQIDSRAEIYRKTVADFMFLNEGKKIDVKCSIGLSRVSENTPTAQVVLENADRACIHALKAGGDQCIHYENTITQQAQVSADNQWADRLSEALENDGFVLHYQPIVSLHGQTQEFYEVLLRLKGGEDSLVYPGKFIHDPNVQPMMAEIDKWVIRNALNVLAQHRQSHPRTRFFIKLTEQSMHEKDFVAWLATSLKANNLDGNSLIFEISETAALTDLEQSKATIQKLQEIGCEFGLEHFGSGIDFSHSLNVLNVDYLKINGTFVQHMATDSENQAAVKAIIDMTRQAGKKCIAEFVSDASSLAILWQLGVDYAQGYYIHEPSDQLDYNFDDDEM